MKINAEGFFESAKGVTGVHARQVRGRWQYRSGGPKGRVIGSGMAPAEFVQQFWLRDDFEGEA